jgi:hypothetical protein
MDRAAAIEFLSAQGFHVRERTWSYGESILVGIDPEIHNGIPVYKIAEYIFPVADDDGPWGLTDFANNRRERTLSSLREAVHAVASALKDAKRERNS